MIGELGEDGWIRVQWDTGSTNSYRQRCGSSKYKVLALASVKTQLSLVKADPGLAFTRPNHFFYFDF